jgi:hemoglobin
MLEPHSACRDALHQGDRMTMADAEAIGAAVARFVDAIVTDPILAPHWEGVDPGRLRRYARGFALQALGGPEYPLGTVDARHSVGLDDVAFDRIESLLEECLADVGVSHDVVGLARRRVAEERDHFIESSTTT